MAHFTLDSRFSILLLFPFEEIRQRKVKKFLNFALFQVQKEENVWSYSTNISQQTFLENSTKGCAQHQRELKILQELKYF